MKSKISRNQQLKSQARNAGFDDCRWTVPLDTDMQVILVNPRRGEFFGWDGGNVVGVFCITSVAGSKWS